MMLTTYLVSFDDYMDSWTIKKNGSPVQDRSMHMMTFRYKEDAVKRARKMAKRDKPSELVVRNKMGDSITEDQTYR